LYIQSTFCSKPSPFYHKIQKYQSSRAKPSLMRQPRVYGAAAKEAILGLLTKKAKQAVNIDNSASIQRRMLYAHRIKGEASEAVATGLVRDAIEYAGRTAAVDEYLTD
jgi:hypothetical protein